jgi:hypothetical protein
MGVRVFVRAVAGALFAGLLLGACGGTSGIVVPPFQQGVIGTGGGHMAAGTVDLTIPPGAFDQNRSIAILPEPNPLPIDPSAGPMTYLPGIMCIGPLGVPLLVDGRMRFCYQESAIPAGSTENDLVLLEWDEAAQFMRVKDRFTPGVTQDFLTHCFTDDAYDELGHVGVAVRQGPAFDLVVSAGPPLQTDGTDSPFGLLLADLDGTNAGAVLPNTQNATGVIPSRDGRRLLYRNEIPQLETADLRVSDVATGAQRILAQNFDNSDRLQLFDPAYGWIADTDVAGWLTEFDDGKSPFFDTIWTGGGSGVPEGEPLYSGPDDAFLRDLRTSPDGSMILVRWTPVFEGSDRLDVVDAQTGDVIGFDLPLALPNQDSVTPRWLPDSSGLYGIEDDGAFVERVDPDGAGLATLYTPPAPIPPIGSVLLDFVVAPSFTAGTASSTRCAYVRVDFIVSALGKTPQFQELFTVDVLGGGQLLENVIGNPAPVTEMAYQPDGQRVWVQFGGIGRDGGGNTEVALPPIFGFGAVVAFSAADASDIRLLPFPISQIDLDRSTQRVIVWQSSFTEDPAFPEPGLYVLSPDLQTQTPLVLEGFQVRGPARFLRSWRMTPGDGIQGTVR